MNGGQVAEQYLIVAPITMAERKSKLNAQMNDVETLLDDIKIPMMNVEV